MQSQRRLKCFSRWFMPGIEIGCATGLANSVLGGGRVICELAFTNVLVEAGPICLSGFPEVGEGVARTQSVGLELQNRLSAGLSPEFFAPLDAVVQLLDRRFHVTTGNR